MFEFFCLLVAFGFFILDIQPYVMEFDRIDLLNETNILERHNISVHRTYETNGIVIYRLYANIKTMVELNDEYQMDVMFYNKRFSNGRYRRTRMSIPRDSLCNAARKYLPPMCRPNERNTSNLVDPETFCPLKKVRDVFFLTQTNEIFSSIYHNFA